MALTGHLLDEVVLGSVRSVHRSISRRMFRAIPGSAPVRVVHDTISHVTYSAIRVGVASVALAGAAYAASREDGDGWLDAVPGRASAWAIAHGVVGDTFESERPSLDLPVRVRTSGGDVPMTPTALAAAFPAATPRVAVFLHGLTESERSWDAPRGHRGPDEPVREDAIVLPDVVAENGWTPVRLRYGTGRAIGRNGVELCGLLEELLDAWPVEVEELALIGHSMGGLVARSAIAHAQDTGATWTTRVSHTVSLGTPHLGSWLERAAARGTWLLRRLPEGEAIARIVDRRARGIKDLRHGALDDASWGEGVFDADGIGDLDRPLPAPTVDRPLLDHAVHHMIAGRLTASASHPVTRVFGDLLVTPPSALGDDGRRRLSGAQIEQLEVATGHFGLPRHPAVAAHLRAWLA